jgi:hypothetical protein
LDLNSWVKFPEACFGFFIPKPRYGEQLRSSKTIAIVPSSETRIDPMHPSRFEKKPNMVIDK